MALSPTFEVRTIVLPEWKQTRQITYVKSVVKDEVRGKYSLTPDLPRISQTGAVTIIFCSLVEKIRSACSRTSKSQGIDQKSKHTIKSGTRKVFF